MRHIYFYNYIFPYHTKYLHLFQSDKLRSLFAVFQEEIKDRIVAGAVTSCSLTLVDWFRCR